MRQRFQREHPPRARRPRLCTGRPIDAPVIMWRRFRSQIAGVATFAAPARSHSKWFSWRRDPFSSLTADHVESGEVTEEHAGSDRVSAAGIDGAAGCGHRVACRVEALNRIAAGVEYPRCGVGP